MAFCGPNNWPSIWNCILWEVGSMAYLKFKFVDRAWNFLKSKSNSSHQKLGFSNQKMQISEQSANRQRRIETLPAAKLSIPPAITLPHDRPRSSGPQFVRFVPIHEFPQSQKLEVKTPRLHEDTATKGSGAKWRDAMKQLRRRNAEDEERRWCKESEETFFRHWWCRISRKCVYNP